MGSIACDDGEQLSAHKIILSSSSEVFEKMLSTNSDQHILLYLRGIPIKDLRSLLQFIYLGEVNLEEDDVGNFLAMARDLKVRGLEDKKVVRVDDEKLLSQSRDRVKIHDDTLNHVNIDSKDNRKTKRKMKKSDLERSDSNINTFNEDKSKINPVTRVSLVNRRRRSLIGIGSKSCEVCGARFASKGSLFNHKKYKHEGVTYSCYECDYKSGQSSNVKLHKQKYHT